jgi:hypothetical protein
MLDASDDVIQKMTSQIANAVTDSLLKRREQELLDQQWHDREFTRVISLTTTDFATARSSAANQAKPVGFKFRSIRVQSATAAGVTVWLIPGKVTTARPEDAIKLNLNDTINFSMMTEGFLFWDAQSGAEMDILFGIDVEFRQGSFILSQQGAVGIDDGDTNTVINAGSVAITDTATAISTLDPYRKNLIVQNYGPDPVVIGGGTGSATAVAGAFGATAFGGVKPGPTDSFFVLLPGETWENRSTAVFSAVTVTGQTAYINVIAQRRPV